MNSCRGVTLIIERKRLCSTTQGQERRTVTFKSALDSADPDTDLLGNLADRQAGGMLTKHGAAS